MVHLIACVAVVLAAGAADYEVVGENLVVNPGFEEADADGAPVGWGGERDVYTRDTTTFHSGGASLKYVNGNADRYVLSSRGIALKPGKMYEVSCWVKTQGVEGDDSGATVCLEWYGANGKYLGGYYPPGFKGDTDWKQIVAMSPRVAEGATGISVSCYLRQGMKGTAWWDDLSVREVRERPLSVVVLHPNYRNELTEAGPAEARIRALLNLADYGLKPEEVELRWRAVFDASGEEIAAGTAVPTGDSFDIAIGKASFKEGIHQVSVSLFNKATNAALDEESFPLTRLMAQPQRACNIDEHNRLLVNGQPFFPLGMYWSSIDAEQLAIYADSAFNCLLPYGPPDQAQLDLAQGKNLKVIYNVKDTYVGATGCPPGIKTEADELEYIRKQVEAYRGHPALLAWYVNDELPLEFKRQLIAHNEFIRS
ncbi:MAG: carbohydrate binding domain-containing protein, partial [Candidatus Hydrogenedentales bacterium]